MIKRESKFYTDKFYVYGTQQLLPITRGELVLHTSQLRKPRDKCPSYVLSLFNKLEDRRLDGEGLGHSYLTNWFLGDGAILKPSSDLSLQGTRIGRYMNKHSSKINSVYVGEEDIFSFLTDSPLENHLDWIATISSQSSLDLKIKELNSLKKL